MQNQSAASIATNTSDEDDNQGAVDHISTEIDGILAALDSADLAPLERLRLSKKLAELRKSLMADLQPMQKLRIARELASVRVALGAQQRGAAKDVAPDPVQTETAPEVVQEQRPDDSPTVDPADEIAAGRTTRESTSKYFGFDPNRKHSQRKKDNAAAMAILDGIDSGSIRKPLTDEQKAALAKYSGTGGNLVGADGKKGSAYEYYTPEPVAAGMWSLLKEIGFSGGNVLDPCGATGVFGASAPVNAAIDAVELNETSGRVSQLVNDGPGFKTTIAPFEKVAAATPDEFYDAVITNVPFGDAAMRGGNELHDTKYRREPLENYFILRSLEKLKPGGLAAFITPPRCISGKGAAQQKLRQRTSRIAEFMGAYRLPNSVFGTADADTITDVVVFRKFSRAALDKVAELAEQNPSVLTDAGVMWPEFLDGDYFRGEGKRFVLGEFVAKNPNKIRDVDRVVNGGSIADISKLLVKFGPSRIDWAKLDAVETQPIVYAEGDTVFHAGETLQMQGGRLVLIETASSVDDAIEAELLAKLTTPLGAVNSKTTYEQAKKTVESMAKSGRALTVPNWLRGVLGAIEKAGEGGSGIWPLAIAGLAVDQVFEEQQADGEGTNYLELYPSLSEEIKRLSSSATRPDSSLPISLRTAIKKIAIHYSRSSGYSAVWRGDVVTHEDTRDEMAKFEAAKYLSGGNGFVTIEQAKEILGAAFDPMSDDDWVVSADGLQVCKADDYYVGNYADFLSGVDAEISAAASDGVRQKLLRQKEQAESRLLRSDPQSMTFTLSSPFVTLEEKAEFLRRFVDPRFAVGLPDGEDKGPQIIVDIVGQPKNERDKLLRRLAVHLNGQRLGLAGAEFSDSARAMAALRSMATTAESQFNGWVKSNRAIMARLSDVVNDPQRIYFRQADDDSPMQIPGLNPNWKSHGYQNSWVRRMGRDFSGINGDGVGLGKTSQCLIAVQHAHSIGTKRRTMIVVPNAVLSNWRKEAGRVYAMTDDCLFVGLRSEKGGGFKVRPSAYDEDFTAVLSGKYKKIFVTYEAFARLRLRETTAQAYDAYLASVDSSYAESDSKKVDEKNKGNRARLIDALISGSGKSMAAPFFEDIGIDSLAVDEAHMLKNSRATVDFKSLKFLSLSDPSGRGLDAQAKAWFVRSGNKRGDGVILLTATPVTNSPLEIYSMLSLAVGDAKLNDMIAGVKGTDDFMNAMCAKESRDETTIDGLEKPYDVFTGLNNVGLLRTALSASATMRTADQVGEQIIVPTADEQATKVTLPQDVVDKLKLYNSAFRYAADELSGKSDNRGSEDAYKYVSETFGEPLELVGHPFNLINKMAMLIADPELDQRATFWTVSDEGKAKSVVDAWNKSAPVEERTRLGPHTDGSAVVGVKKIKDGEDTVELLKIAARAKLDGKRIILDAMDAAVQSSFEDAAERAGLDLDCTVPPKLAALIENFQAEEANPRGVVAGVRTGRVRQLIFCDVLALHSKIRRLLVKRCGVASSSIAIITGRVNGKPEEIIEVQEGFNAEGPDNKYRVVIANEKAEVGINLQKGTQAIHHLTLGWTPDGLTQRNGRGVRQGNETERVTVYHYDADGTFDSYKRMLVGRKADWIGAVMDKAGADSVEVSSGLNRRQLEALAETVGDSDAMAKFQERIATDERLAREESTRGKQVIHLQTINAHNAFSSKYPSAIAWLADKAAALYVLDEHINVLSAKAANPKASANAVLKYQNQIAEYAARRNSLAATINESATILKDGSPSSVDVLIKSSARYIKRGERPVDVIAADIRRGVYSFSVEVKDGSPLHNEWRSEVDMSAGMAEEAKKDYVKLAGTAGAMPADVATKASSGGVAIVGGSVICAGALVERSGDVGVVERHPIQGFVVNFLSEDGKYYKVAASDAISKYTVALPGGSGYDELVSLAAELEDKIAETEGGISPSIAEMLFSKHIPEVAARVTRPVPVKYSARGYGHYTLPSPYHKHVMPAHGVPESASVVRAIAASQAGIVSSTYGDGTYLQFTAANTVAGIRKVDAYEGGVLRGVVNYAIANGLKLTRADYDVICAGESCSYSSLLTNPLPDSTAFAAGATTEDQLVAAAKDWAEKAMRGYDLSTDDAFSSDPIAFVAAADYTAGSRFKGRLAAIIKAKEAPPHTAEAQAPAVQDVAQAATATTASGTLLVGLVGNGDKWATKRWKDQFKAATEQAGFRADWDGDAGQWNIPADVWKKFVEANPRAGMEINAIEPSRYKFVSKPI